jgi:hypothetical protein
MAKIVRTIPSKYHQPKETPFISPDETPTETISESSIPKPKETPQGKICGIHGCLTWYDDPTIMKRHYQRVHGINDFPNMNQLTPRNLNIKNT